MFFFGGGTILHKKAPKPELKSVERIAFEFYLRTGKRLTMPPAPERKFNPYHDPRDGRFTFAPGEPRSLSRSRLF